MALPGAGGASLRAVTLRPVTCGGLCCVSSMALPGAGSRSPLPGRTWSTGASSSLSASVSFTTPGTHIHIAIEVAQLEEWAGAAACQKRNFEGAWQQQRYDGSSRRLMLLLLLVYYFLFFH